jgi:hypothetical protein
MKSKTLARREFLRISGTAVIATAATSLLSPKSLFAATAAGAGFDPLLAVGYAPSAPGEGEYAALASADRILAPDPGFISRGARVTILGSSRAPARKNAPGSLFIDALFPAANENRRFRVWSMNGRADNDSISGNLSFRIPVLSTTGISFIARYRRPSNSAPADAPGLPPVEDDSTPFTFSLGNVAGPNLQRGVYVVALREPSDASGASWERLRLVHGANGLAVADAAFSYVILQVDYDDGRPGGKRRAA